MKSNCRIIDMHAHIYPDKIARKAIENIGEFYHIAMHDSSGTAEGLIVSGAEIGVERYLVHATATTAAQVPHINEYIKRETDAHPEFIGFATLHPDLSEEEIEKETQRAVSMGLKGIKLHPDFQKFYIDEERAEKIYRVCRGKLPILFHTGDSRYEYSRPERLAKIAKKYPDLVCIGAHFGGYERWDETSCYKGLDNVWFDTSSTLFKLPVPDAEKIINNLGVGRFMFGTDYPMWRHGEELERFLSLNLSDGAKEKILYENAAEFLGLKDTE